MKVFEFLFSMRGFTTVMFYVNLVLFVGVIIETFYYAFQGNTDMADIGLMVGAVNFLGLILQRKLIKDYSKK